MLYDDVTCFHEEICIFNPSSCIIKINNNNNTNQIGGKPNNNNSPKCNINNNNIEIYEYNDQEFDEFNKLKPLENIEELIKEPMSGGSKYLKTQTKTQLYETAKTLKIRNRSKMNKPQLCNAVRKCLKAKRT